MSEPIKRSGTKVIHSLPPNATISRVDPLYFYPWLFVVAPHSAPPYLLDGDGNTLEIAPAAPLNHSR